MHNFKIKVLINYCQKNNKKNKKTSSPAPTQQRVGEETLI